MSTLVELLIDATLEWAKNPSDANTERRYEREAAVDSEIQRLQSGLEAANNRAEEAYNKLGNVENLLNNRLAAKEAELDEAREQLEYHNRAEQLIDVTQIKTVNDLQTEVESLRERLRTFRKAWQDQDGNALDIAMDALLDAIPTESPDIAPNPDVCQTCKGEGVVGYTIDGEQPTLEDCPDCLIAVPEQQGGES